MLCLDFGGEVKWGKEEGESNSNPSLEDFLGGEGRGMCSPFFPKNIVLNRGKGVIFV